MDFCGFTPLIKQIVDKQDIKQVCHLLENGDDPNKPDNNMDTPVSHASTYDETYDILQSIINHNGSVITTETSDPIHEAIKYTTRPRTIELLLANHSDISFKSVERAMYWSHPMSITILEKAPLRHIHHLSSTGYESSKFADHVGCVKERLMAYYTNLMHDHFHANIASLISSMLI